MIENTDFTNSTHTYTQFAGENRGMERGKLEHDPQLTRTGKNELRRGLIFQAQHILITIHTRFVYTATLRTRSHGQSMVRNGEERFNH